MGAESRPGQISRLGRPVFQKFDLELPGSGNGERRGNSQRGSAVNIVRGLIQRSQLHLPDINQYVQMWLDTSFEKHGQIPEKEYRTIINVGLGIRLLAYDQLTDMRKALLLVELAQKRTYDKVDRVVFPYEDARLLQMAAAAVNIPYDPGGAEETPENIKKRTFKFADPEEKAPNIQLPAYMTKGLDISHWSSAKMVDADK